MVLRVRGQNAKRFVTRAGIAQSSKRRARVRKRMARKQAQRKAATASRQD